MADPTDLAEAERHVRRWPESISGVGAKQLLAVLAKYDRRMTGSSALDLGVPG